MPAEFGNGTRRRALLAATLLVAACAPSGPAHVSLRYKLHPDPAAGRLDVEAEYRGPSGREVTFFNTMDYAGAASSRFVRGLAVTNGAGHELAVVRDGARWRVFVPPNGLVRYRYSIDLAGLAADGGGAVTSVLDSVHALLYAGQIFVTPAPEAFGAAPAEVGEPEVTARARASVAVEAPRSWQVASSWGAPLARIEFAADSLDALVDGVLALGDYAFEQWKAGDMKLFVAWRGHSRAEQDSLASLVLALAKRYTGVLDRPAGPRGFLVLDAPPRDVRAVAGGAGPAAGSAAAPSATVLSNAATLVVTVPEPLSLAPNGGLDFLVAHELFHWWCGANGVLAYREDALLGMSEGFADYAAARALRGLGRWDEARFRGFLADRRAIWQSASERDEPLDSLSWRYGESAAMGDLVRAKGALVASVLDHELGQGSPDPRRGLPDLYRALARRCSFRPGRCLFGLADFEAALRTVGGEPGRAVDSYEDLAGRGLGPRLGAAIAPERRAPEPHAGP